MSRRHAVLVGVGVVALVGIAMATLLAIDDGDGFGFIDGDGSPSGTYLAVTRRAGRWPTTT